MDVQDQFLAWYRTADEEEEFLYFLRWYQENHQKKLQQYEENFQKRLTFLKENKQSMEAFIKKGFLTQQEMAQFLKDFHAKRPTTNLPAAKLRTPKQIPSSQLFEFSIDPKDFFRKKVELTHFGKYEVLQKVAEGGMGVIYQVRHQELNQIYALKTMIAGENASPETIERFYREAQTLAKLNHPGIVQTVDFGKEGDIYYSVMEYVEGKTLAEQIKSGIPIKEGVFIIKKVLEALYYAHLQGITHRDLKPQNIFVTAEGFPKIGDFGLAKDKHLHLHAEKLTQSGIILGTPAYMPPEQAAGEIDRLDARTDIYAVGVCLYEILTQRCPYEGETVNELFYNVLHEEAAPPSKYNPTVSKSLDAVVLKAIDKRRHKRYPSALAFALDLERFLQGEPVQAKRITVSERLRKWSRKHYPLLTTIFVILFFFIGAGLFFQWTEYRYKKEKIQHHQQKAKLDQEAALKAITPEEKIHFYLKAFNHAHMILTFQSPHLKAEKEKWLIGKKIIELTCQLKEYELASYVALEMQSLGSIREEEKSLLLQQIEEDRKLTLNQHLKTLEEWRLRLKSDEVEVWEIEDALFIISQMTELEVSLQLETWIREGTELLLSESTEKNFPLRFYETMIRAFGRLAQKPSPNILWESLEKLQEKIEHPKIPHWLTETEQYMCWLAGALVNLETNPQIQRFEKIRQKMGKKSLFWKETQNIYKKFLSKSHALDPKEIESKLLLEEAISKQLQKDFEQAQKLSTQAIQSNPNFSEAYLLRAQVAQEQGNILEALKDAHEAVRFDSRNIKTYLYRASLQKELKNFEAAAQDCQLALQLDGKNPEIFYQKGLIRMAKGEHSGALQDFQEVLRLSPSFAYAYYQRAFIFYYYKNDMASALKDLDQCITYNPKISEAYRDRGLIRQLEQHDFTQALLDYDRSIQLNPSDSITYFQRGLLKLTDEKYKEAVVDLTHSLKLNPYQEKAYYALGLAKLAIQDILGAIENYNQLIELYPRNAKAYLERGIAKRKNNDLSGAIDDLDKAIWHNPQLAEAYYRRGLIKEIQGDRKSADHDYQKANQLDPTFKRK